MPINDPLTPENLPRNLIDIYTIIDEEQFFPQSIIDFLLRDHKDCTYDGALNLKIYQQHIIHLIKKKFDKKSMTRLIKQYPELIGVL